MKITDTDLAWLAGIVDGEGSIGLYIYLRTKIPRHEVVRGMVTIVNTDIVMINKIKQIYDSLGVNYSMRHTTQVKQPSWKDSYGIVLQSRRSIQIVLQAITPYLVNKKVHAETCLEFVIQPINTETTSNHIKLAEKLKALNRRGVLYV